MKTPTKEEVAEAKAVLREARYTAAAKTVRAWRIASWRKGRMFRRVSNALSPKEMSMLVKRVVAQVEKNLRKRKKNARQAS